MLIQYRFGSSQGLVDYRRDAFAFALVCFAHVLVIGKPEHLGTQSREISRCQSREISWCRGTVSIPSHARTAAEALTDACMVTQCHGEVF